MNLGLSGKTALVVGGSGGLGRAVALALGGEGARIAVAGRDLDAAAATVEMIAAEGGEALPVRLDLTDIASLDSAVETIRGRLGEVSVLFNNSGGPPPTTAANQPVDLWRAQFEAMVLGVISLTDRVLPGMRQAGWGRIITNTSSGVLAPIPNLAISNALRLSLVGWSKTLAREVAADGITVNVVVPGRIATDRVRALDEARAVRENTSVEAAEAAGIAAIPVGRYGYPEEYAAAVAFLASAQASFITGTMLRVDGGQTPSI
ncbi:MAG: SDR family oxidoreductase [Actinomycetota bacterium]|nr:SDR family oxidoreductase [Actinomycetota bacterium]